MVEAGVERREGWKVLKGDEIKTVYEGRRKGENGGRGVNNW